MKRITPEIKALADAHIEARVNNQFTEISDRRMRMIVQAENPRAEILSQMKDGILFEEVMKQIEAKYIPVTSSVMAGFLGHVSQTYRQQVYRGFKELFQ